jgi:nucleoside-diphosphate-sugar epimerase
MKTVLITGATGNIGRTLRAHLEARHAWEIDSLARDLGFVARDGEKMRVPVVPDCESRPGSAVQRQTMTTADRRSVHLTLTDRSSADLYTSFNPAPPLPRNSPPLAVSMKADLAPLSVGLTNPRR